MRFDNNNFRSLNESINYVQNPHRKLDEALEYADTLETVILSICEELEIDPDELVEMAMTDARLRELKKKRRAAGYHSRADHKIRSRMEREYYSKNVYGKGGKKLMRGKKPVRISSYSEFDRGESS